MEILGTGILVLSLLWGAAFLGSLLARIVAGVYPG